MPQTATKDLHGPDFTTAKLLYMVPPANGERVYTHINADFATGLRKSNFVNEEKEVVIENIRGKEDTVSLDASGFQYVHAPAKHKSFVDDEEVRREYYPESIELLKRLTGASRVELFDHTIRRRRPGEIDDSPDKRQPVAQVHVDQTTAASIARVHRHLPATDAPRLLERRFQIINLSVDQKGDMFPVALIYPDREGETQGVKFNENHKWKYLRGMTPDEVVLIKCFDSIQDGSVAVFTPHTGFSDPATPPDAPLRESIELRALVFYD
ncbi:hypothetical protein NLJ89_g3398 [Agrocybe chaxingu]|uniref:Methyltransferase n=1 Tax=Agrocybe chaxingu TaxID=84603 RepID=A0A9W8MWX4_9AGAR|nr:hypothetical protein NLJ89_g3398 [Agrocybe chaxingu]